jgi:acyl-CoA synthetase (NDP forming)
VAVITTTGGGAATVVDNLGLNGMVAVPPPPAFIEHMASRGMKIRETPIIDLTLAATSAQYKDLLEQLLQTDWCDAVLSVVGSSAQFHPELAVKPLVQADKPVTKALAVFLAPEANASLALLQQAGIEVGEGLVGLHQVQVDLGVQVKTRQGLVEHVAVLTGGAGHHLQAGHGLGGHDHRGQFDDLGPGAKNDHEFFHAVALWVCPWNRTPIGQGQGESGDCTRHWP